MGLLRRFAQQESSATGVKETPFLAETVRAAVVTVNVTIVCVRPYVMMPIFTPTNDKTTPHRMTEIPQTRGEP